MVNSAPGRYRTDVPGFEGQVLSISGGISVLGRNRTTTNSLRRAVAEIHLRGHYRPFSLRATLVSSACLHENNLANGSEPTRLGVVVSEHIILHQMLRTDVLCAVRPKIRSHSTTVFCHKWETTVVLRSVEVEAEDVFRVPRGLFAGVSRAPDSRMAAARTALGCYDGGNPCVRRFEAPSGEKPRRVVVRGRDTRRRYSGRIVWLLWVLRLRLLTHVTFLSLPARSRTWTTGFVDPCMQSGTTRREPVRASTGGER